MKRAIALHVLLLRRIRRFEIAIILGAHFVLGLFLHCALLLLHDWGFSRRTTTCRSCATIFFRLELGSKGGVVINDGFFFPLLLGRWGVGNLREVGVVLGRPVLLL